MHCMYSEYTATVLPIRSTRSHVQFSEDLAERLFTWMKARRLVVLGLKFSDNASFAFQFHEPVQPMMWLKMTGGSLRRGQEFLAMHSGVSSGRPGIRSFHKTGSVYTRLVLIPATHVSGHASSTHRMHAALAVSLHFTCCRWQRRRPPRAISEPLSEPLGVEEASAEEIAEYELEKAVEAAEEASERATDPKAARDFDKSSNVLSVLATQ